MDETLKKEIKSIITYIKETWNEEFHLYLDEESLCFATSNVDFYWNKDFRKYTSTINLEYQNKPILFINLPQRIIDHYIILI